MDATGISFRDINDDRKPVDKRVRGRCLRLWNGSCFSVMAADGVDPRRADPEGVDVNGAAFENVACAEQRNVLDGAALHRPSRDPGIG